MSCHQYNLQHAIKYGTEEATLIYNFIFWISLNKANNKNFYDGRSWTFNSYKALARLFPYWNEKKISRLIDSLIEKKVLLKGNYNKTPYDRTNWYAFVNEKDFLPDFDDPPTVENPIDISQKCQMERTEVSFQKDTSVRPIPDILPDNKQDKEINIPPNVSNAQPKIQERAPNVFTTDMEHEVLVRDHGQEIISKAYEFLAIWKDKKKLGRHESMDDFIQLKKWAIEAVLGHPSNTTMRKVEAYDALTKIESALKDLCPEMLAKGEIVIGKDYMEFIGGQYCAHLNAGEHGFVAQVEGLLRKRNIPVDWMKNL